MSAKVFHSELWGKRDKKYAQLLETDIATTRWADLTPQSPLSLFVPRDLDLASEYETGWAVNDIFPINSVGIVTARDSLTIHWTSEDVWKTVSDFASLEPEDARAKYELGKDVRDWKVELAQADVRSTGPGKDKIVPILYRPFDVRFTYYTGKTRGFICMPRPDVMEHMRNAENLALITSRMTKGETFAHCQAARTIVEVICMSPKTSNNGFVFPAYLYPVAEKKRERMFAAAARHWPPGKDGRRPNLNPKFVADIERRLGLKFITEGTGTLGAATPQEGTGLGFCSPADAGYTASPPSGAVSGASRPPDAGCTAAPQGGAVSGGLSAPDSGCTAAPPSGAASGGFSAPESGCTAAVSAAVSGASRPRFGEVIIRDRGRLPHWEAEGAIYFVTFRLADSLPRPLLDAYTSERNDILATAKKLGRDLSPHERKRLAELFSERIESALDSGAGACHLSNPDIAATVAQALRHFDGQRYRLFAWCVMPNHVHAVFKPLVNHTLADIVHAWKSYTAKQANSALRREGAFWQREYFDHLIRDEAEFHRILGYVAENPGKARLRDWKWVWVWGQDAPTTASETLAVQEQGHTTDADPSPPCQSNAGPQGAPGPGPSGSTGPERTAASPRGSGSGDPACTAAVPAAGWGASRPPQSDNEEQARSPAPEGQPSGTFGPEDIFQYIYAIFHSPTYRKRYEEFLKRDFPRVPLTGNLELFRELCRRGADLVALHLMESDYPAASWNRAERKGPSPFGALLTRFPVKGDDVVENVFYLAPGEPEPGTGKPLPAGAGRVYISKDRPKEGKKGQYFENVPPEIWQFHIGGYQVCQKWLKDRKGRVLTYDDLTHYQHIISALGETIRLMSEIDQVIEAHGGWPIR
ncbi:MAG: type ISP restriction/modification enzyme [bacterium]|nr:type ISP restriction/modification enzyme [bacterium]